MRIFVDSAEDMGLSDVHRVAVRRIGRGDVETATSAGESTKPGQTVVERFFPAQGGGAKLSERTLILVCGPDPLVSPQLLVCCQLTRL